MSDDSWAYEEIASEIASEVAKRKPAHAPPLTGNAALLSEAFDRALEMVGTSGREALFGFMETRYGIHPADIQTKPGIYMSAMRDLLDSAANVVERTAPKNLKDKTGVDAHTLEEAIEKLRRRDLDRRD